VLKSTASESKEIKGKKLCILGNCTAESTMWLMRRKSNYEQPSNRTTHGSTIQWF
jgi:hypothetical protein